MNPDDYDCHCPNCRAASICCECRQVIQGTRFYRGGRIMIDLLKDEYAIVGPRCEACNDRREREVA
jgi:hypothetical protein